jgi:hypothetical protein
MSELYRDAIHLNQTGRYVAHNAVRLALGQSINADWFDLEPATRRYLDRKLQTGERTSQPPAAQPPAAQPATRPAGQPAAQPPAASAERPPTKRGGSEPAPPSTPHPTRTSPTPGPTPSDSTTTDVPQFPVGTDFAVGDATANALVTSGATSELQSAGDRGVPAFPIGSNVPEPSAGAWWLVWFLAVAPSAYRSSGCRSRRQFGVPVAR